MASRFARQFTRAGVPGLIAQFGETITYYAGGTGLGREIQAMIEREQQTITDENIPALATFITVRNSDTDGISATEIDTGFDTVSFEYRVGEAVQTRQIARVESTDNGLVRFEVH